MTGYHSAFGVLLFVASVAWAGGPDEFDAIVDTIPSWDADAGQHPWQDAILAAHVMATAGSSGATQLEHVAAGEDREAALVALWALRFVRVPLSDGVLTAAATSERVEHRRCAVSTACALGMDRAEHQGVWLEALRGTDIRSRRVAADAAAQFVAWSPTTVRAMQELLRDDSFRVRAAALSALTKAPSVEVKTIEMTIKLVSDPEWRVRESACELLGKHASSNAAAARVVRDALERGRAGEKAITALGAMTAFSSESLPLLERLLARYRSDRYLRSLVARSIAFLGGCSAEVTRLLARWATSGLRAKGSKTWHLYKEDGVRALRKARQCAPVLVGFLDGNPEDARTAALALPKLGIEPGLYVPKLIEIIGTGQGIAKSAIWAVKASAIRNEEVRAALRTASTRGDPDCAIAAMEFLWEWESERPRVLSKLREFAGHPATDQRALWALARIGPSASSVVPFLVKTLPHSRHRATVASTLGAIGAAPDLSVPALVRLLRDDDEPAFGAIRALGSFPSHADVAGPALAGNLASVKYRIPVAKTLARLGWKHEKLLATLRGALLSSDERWARVAAETYKNLGGDLVGAYVGALPARRAVLGLGLLGKDANDAVPALMREVSGRNRTAALWALGRIGLPDNADYVARLRGVVVSSEK